MLSNNWFGTMSGVQANMNIESFKVQIATTIEIPYNDIRAIILNNVKADNTYNKLSIIKEVRRTYNIALKEAKTLVDTVSYREGLIGCPVNDEKNLSILMYGDFPKDVEGKQVMSKDTTVQELEREIHT